MIWLPRDLERDLSHIGPDQVDVELVQWLLRRPLIPIGMSVANTFQVLQYGSCLFYGGAFRESAGVASTFDFIEGSLSSGPNIASEQIGANAAAHIIAPPPGVFVRSALAVNVSGGTVAGGVWVQM